MKWLSILAALAAACCLALGSERQSVGVRGREAHLRLHPRSGFLALFSSPVWLAGGALMVLGIVLNVYALATAPLTVVQPIGAIAVVITTVLNARIQRFRLNPLTIWAILACVLGSAGFVLTAIVATEENPAPTPDQERLTAILAMSAAVLFAVIGLIVRRRPSAFVFILGAGVMFGFVAVFVRMASIHFLRGDPGGLFGIPWYHLGIMAAVGLLGVYFVQSAYRHGPPDLVVAGLTVIDPMVGVLTGIIVLHELQPHLPWWVGLCMGAAAAVATLGVIALSRHHPDVIQRREVAQRKASASAAED
ncbi:DMT family transporter [Citricoccus sp. GCM10030269]|uniref:DMT family transporter n=1 Tax=Citricoccus sp. GCM10030269 TaxID=3273388 RepID=UPI003610BC2F